MNGLGNLIDAVAVATLLQVSTRTVQTYVKDGILPPPYKLKGKTLWDAVEIREAIEKMRAK